MAWNSNCRTSLVLFERDRWTTKLGSHSLPLPPTSSLQVSLPYRTDVSFPRLCKSCRRRCFGAISWSCRLDRPPTFWVPHARWRLSLHLPPPYVGARGAILLQISLVNDLEQHRPLAAVD